MTPDELRRLGHEPKKPLQALRERCIDCCGGSLKEVRVCPAVTCPSWPFRLGHDPWKNKRAVSEGQRIALEEGRKKRREKSKDNSCMSLELT